MWSLSVVFPDPSFCLFSYLFQGLEAPALQHLSAIGAVESFDKGILGRLAGLCKNHLDIP